MFPPRRTRTSFALLSMALVALVVSGLLLWSVEDREAAAATITTRDVRLDVVDGPRKKQRVQIDLRLYIPERTPAPAVVLAHGFGGDKNSLSEAARRLSTRGFTVLTYSARGFGESTGKIALNSPAYEVTDARQILDWLARQPEVVNDAEGDPLVGVAGVSYGGALSLLLAGSDMRVDAIAPIMTYNDLTEALLPNSASTDPIPTSTAAHGTSPDNGVFKQVWAGLLFATGTRGATPQSIDRQERSSPASAPPAVTDSATPPPPTGKGPATCGNFTERLCAAYTELAQTGHASPATVELLTAASPMSVTANIDIPTLLIQGVRDPLFGLDQADANARQIAAAGGTVKMVWYAGGHDVSDLGPKLWDRVGDWFAYYLDEPGGPPVPAPGTGFEYQIPAQPTENGEQQAKTIVAGHYPGVNAERVPRFSLPLHGEPAQVINPPGGSATSSSLPRKPGTATGKPPVTNTVQPSDPPEDTAPDGATPVTKPPEQIATFRTGTVEDELLLTGIPQTRLSVSSVPGQPSTGQAVLFATLFDVAPDGTRSRVGTGTAPLRISDLPADGTPVQVDVALPGGVHMIQPGHNLKLVISTTDPAYASPDEPAVHRVALAGRQALSLPSVPGVLVEGETFPTVAVTGIGVIALLVVLATMAIVIVRRYGGRSADPELAEVPLVINDVSKSFSPEQVAVSDLSMRVEPGRIVGLLGPNGAGKTTLLRMALGLVRPDAGELRLFGHPVLPGAPVLSRVGAFIETPGLLPHLSGLDNLRSSWEVCGRPTSQARIDEVLEIAGLGAAADRRVSTYGQGMRQRLALAQAMLGMPDLLLLDEPTNGLDPPQIRRVQEALHRYVATGRTVVLSSHRLGEIEQTCTDAVVLHEGERIVAGSVEEVIGVRSETSFRVDDPQRAAETLRSLEGLGAVSTEGETVHADLAGHQPAIAVNVLVDAGILVHRVGPRRKLEDAFLELVGEERH